MKMIKFTRYVVLGAALLAVTGCDDAKLSTIDNGIYISEAAPSNTFGQHIEEQLVDEGDVIKRLTNFCRKNSEVLNAQLRFPQAKCLHQSLILL